MRSFLRQCNYKENWTLGTGCFICDADADADADTAILMYCLCHWSRKQAVESEEVQFPWAQASVLADYVMVSVSSKVRNIELCPTHTRSWLLTTLLVYRMSLP